MKARVDISKLKIVTFSYIKLTTFSISFAIYIYIIFKIKIKRKNTPVIKSQVFGTRAHMDV